LPNIAMLIATRTDQRQAGGGGLFGSADGNDSLQVSRHGAATGAEASKSHDAVRGHR
jgi:hypothetical protein